MSAPACYGSPICVSARSASCRACAHSAGCLAQARAVLDALPDTPLTRRERLALGVTCIALERAPQGHGGPVTQRVVVASSRGVRRMTLTKEETQRLTALPAKIASQVGRLMELGWFDYARRELLAGRNPGEKGWKKVLCDALLAGQMNRQQLQQALVTQLGLKPESAKVQASVGIAVFAAGGLLREGPRGLRLSAN